ncbi:MAG: bifunctional phosphoribosyl-AMP cyclohydrolase/phosphoribosyl-ATP diphosphatase HisIE [Myxococcota bacterium]|nr:bifunctional phosphoribosyl-AMP cyclohydrolase/phosphoribosyl-ATP diphosphatase HisIE [Myxococcota bacterium]
MRTHRLEGVAALERIDFDKGGGRVTVIVQHRETGEVLMTAAADREAVRLTLETGEVHFTSRTRGLWRKGETSGNTLKLHALLRDCDADALLAVVLPAGPACHTGDRACFGEAPVLEGSALRQLANVLDQRAAQPSGYTGKLLGDRNLRLKKVGEEASELVVACADHDPARIAEEAADLLYHLLVAARAEGVTLANIEAVLAARHPGQPAR